MKIYDIILQGEEATEENAINFAQGFDFCDTEIYENDKYSHSRYYDTIAGIDIYYDYGADYYYFVIPE